MNIARLVIGSVMLLLSASLFATEVDAPDPEMELTVADFQKLSLDELIGRDVISLSEERVGQVEEVVMDEERIPHAIIGVGSFLGIEKGRVAVRLVDLRIEKDRMRLVSTDSREELERNAKLFDPSRYRPLKKSDDTAPVGE